MAPIRRASAASRVAPAARPRSAAVKISSIKNADGGLKAKFDARTQTLTLKGTARGKETRDPYARNATFAERERTPDYLKTEQFGGTISFDFDHDKMPKFDTSRGYTEKNRWYFAHGADVATKRGQTAEQVALALAAKVNASGDYLATVKSNPNGSASLSIQRTGDR